MRASRLLSLLLLLQTRGRMTATELAHELEVSVRTVYRDVEALSGAGVPVYADRGPTGGYQLLDGYRTRLTGLTEQEAATLFLVGLPGLAAELGLAETAANAELKMLAALPPAPRSQAARMRERFHLEVPGWYRASDEVPFLGEVSEAVWEQRPLLMTYRRWGNQVVERRVQPYGLVLKGGSWYLVAAPEGRDPRTYRVSRILTLQTLEGTFAYPPGFDLVRFWGDYSREFLAKMYTAQAVVRLAPDLDGLFVYTVGADAGAAALAGASEPDERGWRTVTLPIESITHARWVLLRLGAQVEVVGPPELRALMSEAAAELTGLYG